MTMSLTRRKKKRVKRKIKSPKSLRIFLKSSSTTSHLRMSFPFLILSSSQQITTLTIANTQSVIQIHSLRTQKLRSMETSSAIIQCCTTTSQTWQILKTSPWTTTKMGSCLAVTIPRDRTIKEKLKHQRILISQLKTQPRCLKLVKGKEFKFINKKRCCKLLKERRGIYNNWKDSFHRIWMCLSSSTSMNLKSNAFYRCLNKLIR